jgi:hypothetical protein
MQAQNTLSTTFKANRKYLILGLTVIFIAVMLFTLFDNPSALNTKTYMYAFTLILPLVFTGWILMDSTMDFRAIGIIGGLFSILILIFYAYSNMSATYYPIINYMLNIIIFLGIMFALAIIYNMTMNNLNRIGGITGFIIEFIFYIPCLFSDFISYLLQQYNLTPNIVLVLFIIEIILILLYIYIPKILKKLIVLPKLTLLNTPVFLDSSRQIATSKQLYPQLYNKSTDLLESDQSAYSKNYCLSMWIYINPQNMSNQSYVNETEIFNYSYTDTKGTIWPKPRITYRYDPTSSLDQYYLYFTPNVKDRMTLTVVGQKWNQFVFNYNNNIVDIFINGNLERTFQLSNHTLPQYDSSDTISIGSENGLDGAICNIVYRSTPLTKYEIANSYNLLMNKNPPIMTE